MNISQLKRALLLLQETEDVSKALAEVEEMEQQLEKADQSIRDIWEDDVTIIHSSFVCDWARKLWYAVYDRLVRNSPDNSCTLQQFADAVRDHEFMYGTYLTDSFIADGYSLISDLWNDNEELG